jgi:hypothetical protein
MSKIEYLREQAARAERLAKTVMDALTAQRLQAFAAECRREIKTRAQNERPRETAYHAPAMENAGDGDAGLNGGLIASMPYAGKRI